MVLSLRSTARGKWNKMEMLDYCSVNLETGEVSLDRAMERDVLLPIDTDLIDRLHCARCTLPTGPASTTETL